MTVSSRLRGFGIARALGAASVVVCLAITLAGQAPYPPAFPRTNATRLFDTERITVWDIVWPKGQPTAMHRHVYDQVGTYYVTGGRIITNEDGTTRPAMTQAGSLSNTRKGTTHIEEGSTDPPLRAVFIELKRDGPSGLPDAGGPAPFPREGAKQMLDDERVAVWDYVWTSGSGALRYAASRETVIVWLGAGTARVSGGVNRAMTIDVKPGTVRHLDRGTPETVEMTSGSPRVIFFQFK